MRGSRDAYCWRMDRGRGAAYDGYGVSCILAGTTATGGRREGQMEKRRPAIIGHLALLAPSLVRPTDQ